MIQLQRILFPTDFSDPAAQAQNYATALTEKFETELHVLHVLESHLNSVPGFAMGLALPSRVEETEQQIQQAFDALLPDDWSDKHHVVRATAKGKAFFEIIRYAKDHDIDLIVMGTHGHSGLEHVLIGNVAERVVRKAPCPVLTVRPDGHQFVMP